jgi:UDP-N-acetylmuramoylalanine--D-glutamate ligase
MRISELAGKKVCIIGFGKEGQATLKAIRTHAPKTDVTIADKNSFVETRGAHLQLGDDYLHDLDRFDVIIKSPGIPPQPELQKVKSKLTTGTQIFFDSIADSGATVIGVTGSKGKSTTSSVIFSILKAAGKNVSLIGNIGEPAIGHIAEAAEDKFFVMELSSYQLMDVTTSPHIAVVTSFFPEHLDYHGTLEAYKEAKSHIAKFQTKADVIFFARDSKGAEEIASVSAGKHMSFVAEEAPVKIEETKLLGEHNRSNIAAAFKVSHLLGIDDNVAIAAIKEFTGLPHRLENLGMHHGLRWIDDAISTTPESAIAALDALGDSVATIILGGQDRGNDFTGLAKRIKDSSVKTVILFPGSGPRIREAIGTAHADVCFHPAESMPVAVELAKKNTMPGKTVLLSTASPSYGMFKNFEEKGDALKRCIL